MIDSETPANSVSIRPFSSGDIERMTKSYRDEELNRLDPPTPSTSDSLYSLFFSIYVYDVHIGVCSVNSVTYESAQIGIRIWDRAYWGRGYGTCVVQALISHVMLALGIPKVWLKVLPENTRAVRCYEKCEFRKTDEMELSGMKFDVMEVVRGPR